MWLRIVELPISLFNWTTSKVVPVVVEELLQHFDNNSHTVLMPVPLTAQATPGSVSARLCNFVPRFLAPLFLAECWSPKAMQPIVVPALVQQENRTHTLASKCQCLCLFNYSSKCHWESIVKWFGCTGVSFQHIAGIADGYVNIIVDNTDFEVMTDLALALHLIASGIVKWVTFHLKSHSTFVLYALEKDLRERVNYHVNWISPPSQRHKIWISVAFILDGWTMALQQRQFLGATYPMWKLTKPLQRDRKVKCDLAFVKGCAKDCWFLGDGMCDIIASFQDVGWLIFSFPC